MSFSIGSYKISSRAVLAPMAGITDAPFRSLCKQFGAGMVTAEMLTSDQQLWSSQKSQLRRIRPNESEPRSVQIAGADPSTMAAAASACVDSGAQIIDINMGCPAKKVCNKAAGSALMRDEKLVATIIQAVVKAVNVPVTLKIRTGWDRHTVNALEIARLAESAGISALTIHGRSRADKFTGQAEYDTITQVKKSVGIPVIANGDINSVTKAQYVLDYTGVDAIMIGRAAQGRPWIFSEINQFLEDGLVGDSISIGEKINVIKTHIGCIHQHYGEFRGLRIARKHIAWYLKDFAGGVNLRRQINSIECATEQLQTLAEWLNQFALLGHNKNNLAA